MAKITRDLVKRMQLQYVTLLCLTACFVSRSNPVKYSGSSPDTKLELVLQCCRLPKYTLKINFLTCLNMQSSGTLFLRWLQLRKTVKNILKKDKLPILIRKNDFVVGAWDEPQGWSAFNFCCCCRLLVLQQPFSTSVWCWKISVCSKYFLLYMRKGVPTSCR